MFNSAGVITTVSIPGIPILDIIEYVSYPWFMVTLFVISGVSARYALERQTNMQFLLKIVQRQLLPSIANIFLCGWLTIWVFQKYFDLSMLSGFEKYYYYFVIATGSVWFLHELFIAQVILVVVRCIDKKDLLGKIGSKFNFPLICLLFFVIWGSAQILNSKMIWTYRNGIYIVSFLLGYEVFSHERVQKTIAKWAWTLIVISCILSIIYTYTYFGQNYTYYSIQKTFLTNAYTWFATLAVFAIGYRWMSKETGFTRYMASRSFGFYVLHYPIMSFMAYIMDRYLHLQVGFMYVLIPVMVAIVLPIVVELVKRIPVLRTLMLGEK